MRSLFVTMVLSMRFLLFLVLFFSPAVTLAFNPFLNQTSIPYEVMTIDARVNERAEYLGDLNGYPQMYEFTLGKEEELTLSLVQKDTENPLKFSLIVVRENNHNAGVTEIGRLGYNEVIWNKRKDGSLALTLLEGQGFIRTIGAGVYRVEVSTPDNFGKYMLVVGKDAVGTGYFKLLGDIVTIQSFFGLPFVAILLSSMVYYPLGIIILMGLFYYTWRNRNRLMEKHG
jgi:hypothetical protein